MNTLSCHEVQEQLDLFAADACDPAVRAALESHLHECPACAADHDRALTTIPKVALPRKDPVYGHDGPLTRLWRRT